MALTILFNGEYNGPRENVIDDVEQEFDAIKLTGTEVEASILLTIEKAKFNSEYSIIDRFGYKLRKEDISNGCKAALCVLNNPNKIVDLKECGLNARDAIVNFCRDGAILINDNSITIRKLEENVSVSLDGYIFDDIDELNYYIDSVRPYDYVPRHKNKEMI